MRRKQEDIYEARIYKILRTETICNAPSYQAVVSDLNKEILGTHSNLGSPADLYQFAPAEERAYHWLVVKK